MAKPCELRLNFYFLNILDPLSAKYSLFTIQSVFSTQNMYKIALYNNTRSELSRTRTNNAKVKKKTFYFIIYNNKNLSTELIFIQCQMLNWSIVFLLGS